MTEKIDITQKNDNIPEHPEPLASTNTPYDDDDELEQEEQEKEENPVITLEDYFEIIMMTSPVAGVKLYLHKHKPTNNHVLSIRKGNSETQPEAIYHE